MEELLKKNDIYEVEIETFSSDGGGVCRLNGRAVFVPRAIPGERWRIRIVKVNRTAVWARGEELLSPSPLRREAECPVYGKCGGCDTMHMSYAAELDFKLSRVNEALARIGGLSLRAEEILGAASTEGYRSKGIYNFGPGFQGGFYRARSHDIVTTDRCRLQPPEFDRAAAALLAWMRGIGIDGYDEGTGKGAIRHLFLRRSDRDFTACVVAATPPVDTVVKALRNACPELTGIVWCVNDRRHNTVLTDRLHTLWGSDTVTQHLCGADFRLSPLTFFQINTAQAERLYTLAGEFAQPQGRTVLDLYCGAGSIGLSVAREAKKIIGSDIVPAAIENAKRNAAANGVENCEYLCGDAGEIAALLAARGEQPDVIIVDPPRKGLDAAVIEAITTMAPERLVYVSCDPATLARDLKELTARGYTPLRCKAVDMFPRTKHVETVVLMSRKAD